MSYHQRLSLIERAAGVYDFAADARATSVPADVVAALTAAGDDTAAKFATLPPPLRHPGLVPGSTVPQDQRSALVRDGGCRNESGMTEAIWPHADLDHDGFPDQAETDHPLPDLSAIPAEFLADPDADPDDFIPPPDPVGIARIDRGMLAENGLIVPGAPVGPLAEEFRLVKRQLLVTHARIANSDRPDKARTILVCSARPRDGKTFCAVNLALSMAAERDSEVLLVDADVAKPDVLRQLGLADGPGLLDALADATLDVEQLVIATDVPNLSVLPAGAKSASDTELLASARTRAVVARLLAANPRRLVIFDSPPALAASPAAVLAMLVGQVMLVVRADRTPKSEVAEAADLLDGCDHIQLMLNATSFVPGTHRFGSYYDGDERA